MNMKATKTFRTIVDSDCKYWNSVHEQWLPVPCHWIGLDSRTIDHVIHDAKDYLDCSHLYRPENYK